MEVLKTDVYDFPRYYDLVYGSDWKAEFDFLRGCFARYGKQGTRHLFEPACGTGRLLFRLGKADFDVSGLDLNARAVDYCNKRLIRHGLPASVWVGDMSDFRLQHRADAAFNMINSFRHLLDEAAAVRHLEMVARSLRRGGIYVLGFHLTPTRGPPMDEESWAARRGNLAVTTRLWTKRRDRKQRIESCGMVYDIYTPTRHIRLNNEIKFRIYTWNHFKALLAKVPAFEIAALHDFAYDLDTPIQVNGETEDVVFILRKS